MADAVIEALTYMRRASNSFSFLNQYVADSYVSDDAGENYACNTLAFKMTRFLCVPLPVRAVVIRGWSSSPTRMSLLILDEYQLMAEGLELVTYTDEAGDYRAAVAVCPERDEAFEF
jgi:hypothetical protein